MSAASKSTTSKSNNTLVPDAYEDDFLTWLQYPTDDAFERSYCSDVFQGGWAPTVDAAIRTLTGWAPQYKKDSNLPCKQTNLPNETGSASTCATFAAKQTGTKTPLFPRSSCDFTGEEALAQGAARAAGYSSQVGQDAYNKVRTIMQPAHAYPQPSSPCDSQNSYYKDHPVKSNLPVSAAPACLPCLPQMVNGGKRSMLDSSASSTAKHDDVSITPFKRARKDSEGQSQTHQTETSRITEERTRNWGKSMGECTEMPLSCSGTQTSMSLSSREMECSGNRKLEDSDIWSEEFANDDSVDRKKNLKPLSRRNRVAEVHNLSERNRRNRINEKLKALQELIPNSTKSDKASVLDEAIEYMKTLQMQLQVVSMRNSMNVTTVMMPMTLPQGHLQMVQPHSVGLGVPIGHAAAMGMSFGAGMETSSSGTALRQCPAAMSQQAMPCQSGSLAGFTRVGFPQSTQTSPIMQYMQEPYGLMSQRFPYMHQFKQPERGEPFLQHCKHDEPTVEKDS